MMKLFDKEVYKRRRAALKQKIGSGIILLPGNIESPMNYADNCYPFRQDSTFLYYFGLDVPGLTGIIDVDNNEELLFGREAEIEDVIWTGVLSSLHEMADHVGISLVFPPEEITKRLQNAIRSKQTVHILPAYRTENKILISDWLEVPVSMIDKYISEPLIKAVVAQREIKEDVEIAEIENAVSLSAEMHMAAMLFAKPGKFEYQVAAEMEKVALAANGRFSFPAIVTVNGQILHNHFRNNKLQKGEMVLSDAGAETTMHYAGDITRTFPAGKYFTTRQKEVYAIVLNAFEHALSLLKPGIEFIEVHRQACIKLIEGLKLLNIVTGDAEEAVEAGVHTLFFQCGLGHMMGLDVHDMENLGEQYVGYTESLRKSSAFGWKSLRLAKKLQQGFVITVEPGIYFIPELIDRWQAENRLKEFINYQQLAGFRSFGGIRIEDDFLITGAGARLLGKRLARNAEAIEDLRAFV